MEKISMIVMYDYEQDVLYATMPFDFRLKWAFPILLPIEGVSRSSDRPSMNVAYANSDTSYFIGYL